ncbi:hypothetical protein DB345_10400 [Spartobacteria bacterium LR76]|nr:hypothetical protein DB345_10400 [Spartobacteria bacterium LR76]
MIKNSSRSALVGAILSVFAIPNSPAALLFSEDFDYTIGDSLPTSSANGDPWRITYSTGVGSAMVNSQTLTPFTEGGLSVTSTGGQLGITNREITHTFAESDLLSSAERAAGGKLYISFVATLQNSSTDGGSGEIKLGGSSNVRFSSSVQWKATTWGLGATSPTFQSSRESTLTSSLIVFEIAYTDANTANISYYVNPEATVSGGVISLTSSPDATLTALNFGYLNQMIINTRYTGLTINADAIKVGTTLGDVLTAVTERSTRALIGGAGLLGFVSHGAPYDPAAETARLRRQ